GVSIPSQTRKILALLKGYLDMIMPDRLLILGDLKHNVPKTSWQEKREVPDFLRQLSAQVRVDIVSGNHDSNLADMAPLGVRVHPSTGIVREGRGYFHGHTWPEEKVVRSGFMVAAHLHPDRKSTRLNSSHVKISYAVFCLKKKTKSPDNLHNYTHQPTY